MIETLPLKVTLRHAGHSSGLLEEIDRGAKRLALLDARISKCEVLVESPGHHHRQGERWRVRIDLTIPGKEVVVDHTRAEEPYSAVHQAFARAVRRIENFRRRRVRVLRHSESLPGR